MKSPNVMFKEAEKGSRGGKKVDVRKAIQTFLGGTIHIGGGMGVGVKGGQLALRRQKVGGRIVKALCEGRHRGS